MSNTNAPRNAIFLIIDALRYDVMQDPDSFAALLPNLAKLARSGFVTRAVANAQSTQFVLPSLFTLSYPLDHGGYNTGIRLRPESFIETLHAHGFTTALYVTANQIGLGDGYQRGFDIIGTTSDYRTQLEHKIARVLYYPIERWRRGDLSEAEVIQIVQDDFGELLDKMIGALAEHDRSIWPVFLNRINSRIGEGCVAERRLLVEDPRAVLWKLRDVAPGVYWRFLGQHKVGRVELFWARAVESLNWRSREILAKQNWFPFLPLQHYQVIAEEVMDRLCRVVDSFGEKRWFMHLHFMDVHDCRSMNRPLHLLFRLKYWRRWKRAVRAGMTRRRFVYDSAAMYLDECLGRFFDHLKRTGRFDNTLILATADHAYQYAESPRTKTPVGLRMHYEDIEVPFLMAGYDPALMPETGALFDSRAMTASFLAALDVPPHDSFARASVFTGGLTAVISENCGSGAVDLVGRDLYFAVTGMRYKIFAEMRGRQLYVTQLYDRQEDPRELENLVARADMRFVAEELAAHLFAERKALFDLRGITGFGGFIYGPTAATAQVGMTQNGGA